MSYILDDILDNNTALINKFKEIETLLKSTNPAIKIT